MQDTPSSYVYSGITNKIIQGYYEVYNLLGLGFSHEVYVESMYISLKKLDLPVQKNSQLPLKYLEEQVGMLKVDLLIEDKVLVQLFTDRTLDIYNIQKVYNQLRSTEIPVGLVFNFGLNPEFKRKESIEWLRDKESRKING